MVLLVPSETAPFRARARPVRFALSTSVMYALVKSTCACAAGASARCCVPVITQGGKPVTVLPGLIAMSALIVPPMTQVNAVPAMIPFGAAAPRLMVGGGLGGGLPAVT